MSKKTTTETKHTVKTCLGLFGEVSTLLMSYSMPILVKFKLNQLLLKVQPTVELYQKSRTEFFQKNGEKIIQEGQEAYKLPDDKIEVFNKQFGELEKQPAEVGELSFSLKDLEKIESAGTGNFPTLFSIVS